MANNITQDELDKSIKATKSIKSLLDNGPLMTILSILTLSVVICVCTVIKTTNDSREREIKLQEKLYERLLHSAEQAGTRAARKEVDEKVVPTVKRIDTTLSTVDSTLTEIKKKRR